MTPSRIRWLAFSAGLLVLAFGYSMLTRTVTILVDGDLVTVATRALTVGGALDAAGLDTGPQDKVEPAQFWLLTDGLVINLQRASLVELEADGEIRYKTSAEKDLLALLSEFGIDLGENDVVLVSGRPLATNDPLPSLFRIHLEVRRSIPVSLTENGQTTSFESSATTLGEALAGQGIQINSADQLSPDAETILSGSMDATLVRAQAVEIAADGETFTLATTATTVGEALAEAGIALQGLDYSEPAEANPIPEDRQIELVRVSETVLLEQQIIPHETNWQEDPEAELDTISVVQLGQDGVQAARVRVHYEDGVEVARQEEGERVLVEPQTQINGYGTQIVLRTVVVDGVTIEYYRAVQVFTTWYSPCNSGVTSCLYGTSSGMDVTKGTIATYLNWYRALKFTTVYVPGYGPGAIGDVGAYPSGEPWIDLAFSEADVAATGGQPWANAYVTLYFTTPVPAYVPLTWPP
jgi:resuscitation-promoting factor RpfB